MNIWKQSSNRPIVHKYFFFILVVFSSIYLNAQNTKEYYVEIKEGVNFEIQNTQTNSDGTVTLSTNNSILTTIINSKNPYEFAKAFPTAVTPMLQRVYKINVSENVNLTNLSNSSDIENIEQVGEFELAGHFPNDYIELLFENLANPALELIKAPLAWTITQGDPNILIGIVDGGTNITHEDLQGKIVQDLDGMNYPLSHGTAVASLAAANTDNGIGMAAIGYKCRMVTADIFNTNRVLEVSQIPGIKVINCSWGGTTYNSYEESVYQEIHASGVLVVAAAHNPSESTYYYPASYDTTISVTTVGSRYPIGYIHDLGFGVMWGYSWQDCHERRPNDGSQGDCNIHNDKVDVSVPNQFIISATDDYVEYPSGYRPQDNTSSATPIVSGLAALIFSINPNFTAQQVKDIIKNTTDDIYHIPYNQQYLGKLGTGRINAYRAVKTAKCMVSPTPGLDLAMQNSNLDDFVEPDINTEILWQSDDIWVRNQKDGNLIDVHQNPEYDPNNPNYVYVRVTNNSCVTSSGNDSLKLYWAKANTSLSWPQSWNGTLFVEDPVTQEDILMCDEVGTLNIPILGAGESKLLEFAWSVPNPQDYINIDNGNPWHFCLLGRIISLEDPMTFPEISAITQNVKNNNNIAWKNTTVVDIFPDTPSQIGAVVAVSNPFAVAKAFNLEFIKKTNEPGQAIYDEAEVSIGMDPVIYDAWVTGGKQGQNFNSTKTANKKIVAGNNMLLSNILLDGNELGTIFVKFNFLTAQLTSKKEFTYHVIQRDAVTNEIIGGETYQVQKRPRPVFNANAGNDETINRSESVTISASQINEAAVYNWYDPEGNLIYTGTNLTVSPNVSKTYKLEIITDTDGYKDYDEVAVTVNPYKLESLAPNPATNQVTVNYIADEANSAYLMVVSTVTGISNNYILDVNQTSVNLNISNYTSGTYSVALVCDGEIVDSKNLAKQ